MRGQHDSESILEYNLYIRFTGYEPLPPTMAKIPPSSHAWSLHCDRYGRRRSDFLSAFDDAKKEGDNTSTRRERHTNLTTGRLLFPFKRYRRTYLTIIRRELIGTSNKPSDFVERRIPMTPEVCCCRCDLLGAGHLSR